MRSVFFPDEEVTENDLYFVCSMVERIARQLKQPNKYVVNRMGHRALAEKLSLANVLHCGNPLAVAADWIDAYRLEPGGHDVCAVDPEYCERVPTVLQMGKVYKRLILAVMELEDEDDYAQAMLRVYNHPICETLDNYNCSAYYEPSYYITRSYYTGGYF